MDPNLLQFPGPEYPGFDGFLGTRATLLLDLLVLAMALVLVVLAWSIYQVKYQRRYQLHKWVQIVLACILLVAVALFELDIRLHGWEERAAGELGGSASSMVWTSLYVHLVFAVTTVILWPVVIVRAVRGFPSPPLPSPHSQSHKFWAWVAAGDMLMTTLTGWLFYYLAFVR